MLSTTEVLQGAKNQRTAEGLRKKANQRPIIPIARYTAVLTLGAAEREPEETMYGVPGRLIVLWNASLTNDEGGIYSLQFFKTTPEDFRFNKVTDEWVASGEPGHKLINPRTEGKHWIQLTEFDKNDEYDVEQLVQMIQEQTYNLTIGHTMENEAGEKVWPRNAEMLQKALNEGYVSLSHFVNNVYVKKDNAV